jgi:hypothetical protein
MGERGRESDLKAGHVRPKNEYIRMYIRPYSCWVSSESCVRTYVSKFERMRAV